MPAQSQPPHSHHAPIRELTVQQRLANLRASYAATGSFALILAMQLLQPSATLPDTDDDRSDIPTATEPERT